MLTALAASMCGGGFPCMLCCVSSSLQVLCEVQPLGWFKVPCSWLALLQSLALAKLHEHISQPGGSK